MSDRFTIREDTKDGYYGREVFIVDAATGNEYRIGGGAPEDATHYRDFSWIVPLLNGVSRPLPEPVGEIEFSERGFARWPTTPTTRDEEVEVYESSAAAGPHLWLGVRGVAHLSEPTVREHLAPSDGFPGVWLAPGHMAAHLSLAQAEQLHATLGQAVEFMRQRDREWLDFPTESDGA